MICINHSLDCLALSSYSFVPADASTEIAITMGCLTCFKTVCCLQGSLFRLQEVRVLGKPGVSQLLELAGQATICYVVKDEASDDAKHIASAPLLQLEGLGTSDEALVASCKAGTATEVDFDRRGLAGMGASSEATLQPGSEREIALRLVGMCHYMLAANGYPGSARACEHSALAESSSCGSEQHYNEPCSLTGSDEELSSSQASGEHSKGSVKHTGPTACRGQLCMPISAGSGEPCNWLRQTHARMAEQYCLQRILLLARVAADLECQALLVS